MILNLCFGVATVAFFASDSLTGIVEQFGIATSGGRRGVCGSQNLRQRIACRLHERAHIFNGVRGCVALFLGFYLIEIFRIHHLAGLVCLMAVASLILLTQRNSRPEERYGSR